MPKRQVSWPGCRSAGRRDGPHDAPVCGTGYGDHAIFPNLLEIPTDYAHASTESAIPAVAAAAIFALLGGPISVEHLGWDPAAAGDLITAFACPFTNFGALLAVN